MTASYPVRKSLAVETLESRSLMAGDVAAAVFGQTLLLEGDAEANGLTVTYHAGSKTYTIHGREAGGSPTTVNGLDTTQAGNVVSFANVKRVEIRMNGGDDQLDFGNAAAVDLAITKYLAIDMGEGNDTLAIGQAGNPAGGTDPVAIRVRLGSGLYVNLGEGDDVAEFAHLDLGGALLIYAGGGNDDVSFATEFTPDGATEPTLFPIRVKKNATIFLSEGDDVLDLKNGVVRGKLRINDSAGLGDINLYNLTIGKQLDVDTGNDADVIALDYVYTGQMTFDTNAGIDDLKMDHCKAKSVNVKLGAQRDKFDIRHTYISQYTLLHGGPQGSSYVRGPGNELRGMLRRDME